MARAALLDVDGTLIEANYRHALAWYRKGEAEKIAETPDQHQEVPAS